MYTTAIIFGAFYFIFSENDYVIEQKNPYNLSKN